MPVFCVSRGDSASATNAAPPQPTLANTWESSWVGPSRRVIFRSAIILHTCPLRSYPPAALNCGSKFEEGYFFFQNYIPPYFLQRGRRPRLGNKGLFCSCSAPALPQQRWQRPEPRPLPNQPNSARASSTATSGSWLVLGRALFPTRSLHRHQGVLMTLCVVLQGSLIITSGDHV